MVQELESVNATARQYGGYNDYQAGYVECCDEVVDPIILLGVLAGIGGLTFLLRQQVLTFITGRSFDTGYLPDQIKSVENVVSFYNDIERFSSSQNEIEDGKSGYKCYFEAAPCFLESIKLQIESRTTELELISQIFGALLEYFNTGDIKESWNRLRQHKMAANTLTCFKQFNSC